MNKLNLSSVLVLDTSSILDSMKRIDKTGIKMAVVVDEGKRLIGTVTDGDIRRGILSGVNVEEKVANVCNKGCVFLKDGFSELEAIKLVKDKQIIGLPIVNEKKIVKDFVFLSNSNLIHIVKLGQTNKRLVDKILVIGGAGYIGSVLVEELLNKNYKVKVLDNFTYGKESLSRLERHHNLEILRGDTRHIEEVVESIKDVDAVVHLGEVVGDPACAINPQITQEVNYLATKTIGEISKYFQVNRFIYISSCSVYGCSNYDELLLEESDLNPVSLYAKMKVSSEKALKELSDPNFKPTILRLGTVFGVSNRPRFDLVVNLLSAKAVREGSISIYGGDQWRPHVHVKDVTKTIISILQSPLEQVSGEIFNVGDESNNLKIVQIGTLLKNIFPLLTVVNQPGKDKRNYKVSFKKLRGKLNIKLDTSVETGILEIKDFLEKNPNIDFNNPKYSNLKTVQMQQ